MYDFGTLLACNITQQSSEARFRAGW